MIEHLQVGQSCYFYECKRPLSQNAIDQLFRGLRAQARKPSQNVFRVDRIGLAEACYSAICFSYERDVSFLAVDAKVVERVFGFVLIVERGPHIAVFKSGLDLPSDFKSTFLGKIPNERIESAIARHDAVFEKLRLRNMSISPFALRSKSLEARNLENAVAISSASRFIPHGYSVRRDDGVYSATPSTGRISIRADRASVEAAVAWVTHVSHQLEAEDGAVSSFIRNFARSIELNALPAKVYPTFVGIDTAALADALFTVDNGIRLISKSGDAVESLSKTASETLLAALEAAFPIINRRGIYEVTAENGDTLIATIRIGATRIALRGLDLPIIREIFVERCDIPMGEDPEAISLASYIDRENLFTVLFTDVTLAYIDGALFRDDALAAGGAALLAHLQVDRSLEKTTSEKGTFTPGQRAFTPDSVFRSVVDTIANSDDVLLCDDLGDEWADFIGICTRSNPSMISFYHAKHGDRSLSASAFHDSVGQAIKNLGRMNLPADMLIGKLKSWGSFYRNDGVQTNIARIVRGGPAQEVADKIARVRGAPDVLMRAFIVTSSLSYAQVENTLKAIASGKRPSPHFIQLYWLLMSYFSACTEMDVRGYVICRP